MAQEQFNHGVRVLESSDGTRPVSTVESSIIGFVATAPDAENVAASLIHGAGTSQLTFTAKQAGDEGNDITVAIIDPETEDAVFSVSLSGTDITVNLATDGAGAITSTAALIKAALDANTNIAALIDTVSGGTGVVEAMAQTNLSGGETSANSASKASAILGAGTGQLTVTAVNAGIAGNSISVRLRHPGVISSPLTVSLSGSAIVVNLATDGAGVISSTADAVKAAMDGNTGIASLVTVLSGGAGVASPTVTIRLGGGQDEAFPLNTPVRIAGASDPLISRLGNAGTARKYVDDIMRQIGAVIVLVRVPEEEDDQDQTDAVLVGIDKLLTSESTLGLVPRLLVAPEFSNQKLVADQLVSVANKLRAFVFADGPNTADSDAINYAMQFGSERLAIIDPWIVRAGVDHAPSATWAAIAAKTDNELGFWWSPSNKEILGFDGTSRPVSYRDGDPTSSANLLNAANVTTIIRQNGYRIWGNRTTSADPKWTFVSVRRTGDIMNDSLARAHRWAVDRRIHRTYFEDVSENVNAYLANLVNLGAILGGKCWADPADNTVATVPLGKALFKFDWTPCYPAEDVVFESIQTETYLSELFPNSAQ